MTILHALILGLVEGITEFIPVSSTGHLILTSHLLGVPQTDFLKTFEIVIQSGALCAVLWFFVMKLWKEPGYIKKLIVAFLPTALVGFFLYPLVKEWLGNPWIVVWSLILGGIALIVVEWYVHAREHRRLASTAPMTTRESFIVGCAQVLAFIPGVSRSGATIVGGLLLNIPRALIVEFSFLLAVPTILAASGLDLLKSNVVWDSQSLILCAVGFVTAFVSALVVMKWFVRYVSNHSFTLFGIYRIVIAIVFIIIYR